MDLGKTLWNLSREGGQPLNYEVLHRWFSDSPETFLLFITVGCIGVLSSLFWLGYAVSKIQNLSFRVSIVTFPLVVIGATFVGKSLGQAEYAFGLTLLIGGIYLYCSYWFGRWIKWLHG